MEVLAAFSRSYPTALVASDCNRYKDLVSELQSGSVVPSLSEGFIHKCLGDMVGLGLLD